MALIFSSACIFPSLALQGLRLRARTAEHLALVERKAALEAQLSALQARTDPHFLFNSLNTVASLISEDPVLAERTLAARRCPARSACRRSARIASTHGPRWFKAQIDRAN